MVERLGELAVFLENIAQVTARDGIGRLQPREVGPRVFRFLELAQPKQDGAEIVQGLGIIGSELDGLLKAGDRRVGLFELFESETEVVVGFGKLRLEFDGTA